MCGLKLYILEEMEYTVLSHPSRVCGLKHSTSKTIRDVGKSHPSRVCGLKLVLVVMQARVLPVTPFAGVWIETIMLNSYSMRPIVVPSQVLCIKT